MSRWTLTAGDSLRLLTEIDDNTVDAVVTDPPYSSGGAFRGDRQGKTTDKYLSTGARSADRLPEFFGDTRDQRGLLAWCSQWMAEAWRATIDGGALAVFSDWRIPTISDALQAGGWVWRGVGVWVKPQHKSRPAIGGFRLDTEFVLLGSRGPRTAGECLPGTWRAAAPASETRLHITEKPQAVLRDLVRLAPPDGVILDPFAGSASSGVAALTEGRHWIGFELSREYVAIGQRRLELLAKAGADVAQDGQTIFDEVTA